MRRDTTALFLISAVLLVAIALTSGCSPTGPQWVDSGTAYTSATISGTLAKVDISSFASTSAGNTTQARHNALTELRKRGRAASSAADLITKTLPATERGIPAYVERASYNGQPAVIIVEAIGPASAKLTTKRLWVISETGAVLFVGTR